MAHNPIVLYAMTDAITAKMAQKVIAYHGVIVLFI